MRTILITFFIICASTACFCQDYVFRVMVNKGSNMFKKESETKWQPVKKGISFNIGDWIRIANDAYLGLVHNSGKTTALKNPGVFEISKLASEIGLQKKGIAAKYIEFVFNTIEQKPAVSDNNQVVVTRGAEKRIHLLLPSNAKALNRIIILTWNPIPGENTYVVTVMGIFEDILIQEETNTNRFTLNMDLAALNQENILIIRVSLKANAEVHSGEHVISTLSNNEIEVLQSELLPLIQEISQESSLDQIILASFYEQQDLLIDAIYCYLEAIQLSPEVADYKEMYDNFMIRNKLK